MEGEAPAEKIGKLEQYRVVSNFDKTPYPYQEVTDISNLPGIFLAKKKILHPHYLVQFSWPNNWGSETFLAWKLKNDQRKLGYLANPDALFVHMKFGWNLNNLPLFDESIETLPKNLSFREFLVLSNQKRPHTGYRETIRLKDWYQYKIAFSTFLYLSQGFPPSGFVKGIEPYV
ncbi:MAG: hypothetical protein ACE5I8_05330, partial [Thermodesulfobacteriota bacterium]